jgi:hypothetical protein
MPELLLIVFILNIALTLLDASLGYHLAPHLLRLSPQDENSDPAVVIRSIRRMLSGVVLLYTFFNCLAYFRQDTTLMAVVTTLIMLDLGGQLYVRYRARRRGGDTP